MPDKKIKANSGALILGNTGEEVQIAGNLTVSGTTSGVTAASAANDWASSTTYGLNQIVVSPDGATYRASEAHESGALFDYTKWEQIGVSNGAILSEWTSYTSSLKDASGTTWSGVNVSGYWRRNAENIELAVTTVPTTTPSGGSNFFEWELPNGLTALALTDAPFLGSVYTYNQSHNAGNGIPGSATVHIAPAGNRFRILFAEQPLNANYYTVSHPAAWQSGDRIKFTTSIPVAEWQGTGTTNSQTQVEYAYNSSVTTATDTTSFAYGPEGKEVESFAPSATGSVIKRVRFQNDIKDTDTVEIQLQSRADDFWSSNNASFSSIPTPLTFYGIFLERVTGNATDVDVQFMSKPNAAAPWSAFETEGLRWRLVKHSNAAMVGVDEATTDKRGLRSEKTILETNGIFSGTATGGWDNLTTIAIPSDGTWLLKGDINLGGASETTGTKSIAISAYSGNTTTDQRNGQNTNYIIVVTPGGYFEPHLSATWVVTTTGAQTFYLKAKDTGSGTHSVHWGYQAVKL